MTDVIHAFSAALRSMLHPRMLALMLWPMVLALVAWFSLAWWQWDRWTQWLDSALLTSDIGRWIAEHGLGAILHMSSWLLLMLLLAPAILITAALIAAFIAMPLIVNFVEGRYYPGLERRRGGTIVGSIVNALVATIVFLLLWIVTLPLWLTGIFAPLLPALLSAYLNQRLFRYDALAEHASAEELHTIFSRRRGRMYMLGLLLALLYYVPFLNLVVPVLSGIAFTHYGLAELARMRARKGEE
jgi:CysZ protein